MNWIIEQTANLSNGGEALNRQQAVRLLASDGNKNAHEWRVKVKDENGGVDLTGMSVMAYFVNANGETVLVEGSVTNNVASVVFPSTVYAIPGLVKATMDVSRENDFAVSVGAISFMVQDSQTDDIIDPDSIIATTVADLVQDAVDELAEDVTTGLEQINGLVASVRGAYTGATLFDNNDGVVARIVNTSYNLSDNFENYNEVGVYLSWLYDNSENVYKTNVFRLDVNQLVKENGKAIIVLNDPSASNDYSEYDKDESDPSKIPDRDIEVIELTFSFVQNTFRITRAVRKIIHGQTINNVNVWTRVIKADEDFVQNTGILIDKIVGYKYLEDVENADARRGFYRKADYYDLYDSFGTGIRRNSANVYSLAHGVSCATDEDLLPLQVGGIDALTGGNIQSDRHYCRIGYRHYEKTLLFTLPKGTYEYCAWFNTSGSVSSAHYSLTGGEWVTGSTVIPRTTESETVRISIRRVDGAEIPNTEWETISAAATFTDLTDSSLSTKGSPADAKAVGDLGALLVSKGVITQSEWDTLTSNNA